MSGYGSRPASPSWQDNVMLFIVSSLTMVTMGASHPTSDVSYCISLTTSTWASRTIPGTMTVFYLTLHVISPGSWAWVSYTAASHSPPDHHQHDHCNIQTSGVSLTDTRNTETKFISHSLNMSPLFVKTQEWRLSVLRLEVKCENPDTACSVCCKEYNTTRFNLQWK